MPRYLLDFKNITKMSHIEECLKGLQVDAKKSLKKLSERTFEIDARDYTRVDLVQLYQFIGEGGHIFIYNYTSGEELFYQKRPRGRKKAKAKDSELDAQTLRCLNTHRAGRSV
jgi:hypothetical protein